MAAVVLLWIVVGLLVVLAVISSVGGFAGMLLQHAARAVTPSKVAYQVEVGPTGMPWIGTLNLDMSWLWAPAYWFHYFRNPPRTWSVSVAVLEKKTLGPDLLNERFESYRDALQRFRELKSQLISGDLHLSQDL